jgi:spore coat protein U-like protein
MKKLVSVLLALLACIAFSGIVYADSTTSSLYVNVNVVPVCQVYTSSVYFGDVLAGTTNVANGDVQVKCPSLTPYNIALDAGLNYSGTWRRVNNYVYPTSYIDYGLYKDSAYTLQWGDSNYADTYPNGSSLADIGNGLSQSHTVYGRLTVPLGAPTSNYSDTVTVTVYF